MRPLLQILTVFVIACWSASCTPDRGCTETTADNYDPEAKEDDGTCIPARDKMIGNYTYNRFWTDVFLEVEDNDAGYFQITEANTADNAFNMFLNGNQIVQGAVTANAIAIEAFQDEALYFGIPFTQTFTGGGNWLVADSVDMSFTLTTQVPVDVQGNPPQLITVPFTYYYYCTKVD